ncbi:SDR family NAD(P)-dependent oxidoreductase [Sphingobacteriales bacterium CHB3]|nr:SDR family NAD(P)-dependent oxidoreductase [Sphingobacteriales bacterium CHB3]
MNQRIVIITGANSGIGKVAATKFAAEGHHVVMACRNLERSRKALDDIRLQTESDQVELMQVDVSSFASIRRFCPEFREKHARLDILIHNAAYFEYGKKEYQLSPDGIELTFATNAFGPFLMTHLLRDSLKKSDDARILNACTDNVMHFLDPKRKIEFDNLRGEHRDNRPYSVYKMYGDSKMALLLLTFKLAEEYRTDGIKINAIIIPGVKLSTETRKKLSFRYRFIATIMNPLWLPVKVMANNYVHICTDDGFRSVTGQAIGKKNSILPPARQQSASDKIREFITFGYVPKYAHDPGNVETIWKMATELIDKPT